MLRSALRRDRPGSGLRVKGCSANASPGLGPGRHVCRAAFHQRHRAQGMHAGRLQSGLVAWLNHCDKRIFRRVSGPLI